MRPSKARVCRGSTYTCPNVIRRLARMGVSSSTSATADNEIDYGLVLRSAVGHRAAPSASAGVSRQSGSSPCGGRSAASGSQPCKSIIQNSGAGCLRDRLEVAQALSPETPARLGDKRDRAATILRTSVAGRIRVVRSVPPIALSSSSAESIRIVVRRFNHSAMLRDNQQDGYIRQRLFG